MNPIKVLDFRSYHRINEDDSTEKGETKTSGAVDQILNLFFQAYGGLVTKIGDYKDAANDLTGVAKEADPAKKGQAMLDVLTKVAGKVDPKYKEAANQLIVAAKRIKEAYDSAIQTDEGKKALDKIKDDIYDRIIGFLDSLKAAAKSAPKVEAKKEDAKKENSDDDDDDDTSYEDETGSKVASTMESWVEEDHLHLFEKNTFTDDRDEIIKDITPQITLAKDLSKNPASPDLGAKYKSIASSLEKLQSELSQGNEEAWKKMKRRERKERIAAIQDEVKKYKEELVTVSMNAVKNLGIDKNVFAKISQAMELIKGSIDLMDKVDKAEMEKAKKDEEEEAKKKEDEEAAESKDTETFDEIKSGSSDGKNLQKKGPNFDKIKAAQEKINTLLPEKEKIKADGLYGTNTEKAIVKIASMFKPLAPDLLANADGKSLTPEFQQFLSKLEKNKDKIAGLFK